MAFQCSLCSRTWNIFMLSSLLNDYYVMMMMTIIITTNTGTRYSLLVCCSFLFPWMKSRQFLVVSISGKDSSKLKKTTLNKITINLSKTGPKRKVIFCELSYYKCNNLHL